MKKRVLPALLLIFALLIPASAHSGRTDAFGGHRDNSNASGLGPYHYHHGYPAHLHPGGVCPYTSSGASGNSSGGSSGAPSIGTATISDRYTEGYGDGYDEGYAGGYAAGKADGSAEAQAAAQAEKQSAVNAAFEEGRQAGHDGREAYYEKLHEKYSKYILIAAGAVLLVFAGLLVFIRMMKINFRHQLIDASAKLSRMSSDFAEVRNKSESLAAVNRSLRIKNTELERQLARQSSYIRKLEKQVSTLHTNSKALPKPSVPDPSKKFDYWPSKIHALPEQQRRIQRALSEPFQIIKYQDFIYTVRSVSSKKEYLVTLRSCSCKDFEQNTKGKAPCKHIYFLAKHLGAPIESFLEPNS